MPAAREGEGTAPRAGGERWTPWAGPLVALALSLPFLGAGLASDDGAIVGFVADRPPLVDLLGPQFGVSSMRFWRPLMTLSFDLQEAWTGVTAWPLRLFNALAHAAAAGLAGLLARRLGAGALGALLAAVWVATFPHQGGTTGWPSGRSDGLSLPLMATALLLTARGRTAWAVLPGALALMTKEMAWIQAPAAFALLLARGDGWRAALRASAPLVVLVTVALAIRPLLLGTLIGGYAGAEPDPGAIARGTPEAWARALGPSLAVPAALAIAAAVARSMGALRALVAGALVSWLGTALLSQMVQGGAIPPEHVRTFHTPDALLGVAAAVGLGHLARRRHAQRRHEDRAARAAFALALVVCAAALGWRAAAARADLARWADAGDQAEAEIAAARSEAQALGPSLLPLLDPRFSRLDPSGRAYVLHWGVADRFRAPFEPAPRPVWPWRPAFADPRQARAWWGAAEGPAYDGAAAARAGLVALEFEGAALRPTPGAPVATLRIDPADYVGDAVGPLVRLRVEGDDAAELARAAGGEALLATELGYAAAALSEEALAALFGEGLSSRHLLTSGGGALFELIAFAVDFGAREALVEVRLTDGSGAALARSRFLRLDFAPGLRAALAYR